MSRRGYEPPRAEHAPLTVRVTEAGGVSLEALLASVRALRDELDVAVQVLRADRVVSWRHLWMAAVHAARAARDGRMRAADAAVEFLLYAAADRQIHRALDMMGVRPGGVSELVVVALARVDDARFAAALRRVGLPDGAPWAERDAPRTPAAKEAAWTWWQGRLEVGDRAAVEDALVAKMALLALDRA